MRGLTITTGIVGGTALIATLMMTGGTYGQTEADKPVVSLPSAQTQQDAVFQLGSLGGKSNSSGGELKSSQQTKPNPSSGVPQKQQQGPTEWVQKVIVPKPDSETATMIFKLLETPIDGPMSLKSLGEMPDVPVFLDHRAIAEAAVALKTADIVFDGQRMPLRSALRKMLQPHALKYEVENDGLVITADFEELLR